MVCETHEIFETHSFSVINREACYKGMEEAELVAIGDFGWVGVDNFAVFELYDVLGRPRFGLIEPAAAYART